MAVIKNLDIYLSKLDKLADVGKRATLLQAVRAGGAVVEANAKANVQEQELIDTGNLLNSIQKQHENATNESAYVQIGTPVVYAAIHEFGGVIPNAFGRNVIVHVPARPYLRPALDDRDNISNAMADVIEVAIRRANG